MNIVLFFSPFVSASYIPLGVAQLKGYIEKKMPGVCVRTVDMNNAFFNRLAEKDFFCDFKRLWGGDFKAAKGRSAFVLGSASQYQDNKYYSLGVSFLRDKSLNFFYIPQYFNYWNRQVEEFFLYWENRCNRIFNAQLYEKLAMSGGQEKFFFDMMGNGFLEKTDVVGFSVFDRQQLPFSLLAAQLIKRKFNVPVIFGGALFPHIDIRLFLQQHPFVDFVVEGEGEETLVQFIHNYKSKKYSEVSGLFYRNGRNIVSTSRKFMRNLDDLSVPDFSQLRLQNYYLPEIVLPLMFSRGCFWAKCTFCAYFKNHPVSYRTKSIEHFIEEIRYFKNRGIRYFMIIDDVISAGHLNKISNALIREKIHVFFGVIARPEKNFSRKVLRTMYKAGGRLICWGVESSSQRILNLMNKGTEIKMIRKVLDDSLRAGFHVVAFMIQGFPTQTEKEIMADIRFVQKYSCERFEAATSPFDLEKNTFIHNNSSRFAINVRTGRKNSLYDDGMHYKSKQQIDWQAVFQKEHRLGIYVRKNFPRMFRTSVYAQSLIHAAADIHGA